MTHPQHVDKAMINEVDLVKASTYEPLLGNNFRVRVSPECVLTAKLVEISPLQPATVRDDLPIRKDPFALVFQFDGETQFDQGTFIVEHEATGAQDMFLAPIGFGEYEVIFN